MGRLRHALAFGAFAAAATSPVTARLAQGPRGMDPLAVVCATAEAGAVTCSAVPPGGSATDIVWAAPLVEGAAVAASDSRSAQSDTGQGPDHDAPFPEWLGAGVMAHERDIRTAARELDLDPLALAILVSIECPSGNAACTSYAGARGIAQVMPGTAATIQGVTGYPCATSPHDPLTSIRCGGWYFREGLRQASGVWRAGDEAPALGAAGIGYNAGHGYIGVVVSHVRAGGYVCDAPAPAESRKWCNLFVDAWKRAGRS
jgi:hypothetical protein